MHALDIKVLHKLLNVKRGPILCFISALQEKYFCQFCNKTLSVLAEGFICTSQKMGSRTAAAR